jgi:glycosyltransferase involved in cell wall biosynthesis
MNSLSLPNGAFSVAGKPVILCFSHLRWNFVYQRPQHILSLAALDHTVFFIEEPLFEQADSYLHIEFGTAGVLVVRPVVDSRRDPDIEQRRLISAMVSVINAPWVIHWFYTPMAMAFAAEMPSDLVVYDCMDELSAFRFAPAELREREAELLNRADLVFTGGSSLFAAKRGMHDDVHCFPSSVDKAHFGKARARPVDPLRQSHIPHPRIGFFGVIDERMDLELVASAAADLPDVHFVMVGPVVKIDQNDLPKAPNIHWVGGIPYADLPAYLGNWQAGWMPFALNESTRFISPTKTPEFLAAGLAVTSTAVPDVVADWSSNCLVQIADGKSMSAALRSSLSPAAPDWLQRVDARLASMSWANTWGEMQALIAAKSRVGVLA